MNPPPKQVTSAPPAALLPQQTPQLPIWQRPWFWLVAFVAAAAVLRFLNIGVLSLWSDEGWSARMAMSPLGVVLQAAANEAHPPLYYIMLNFWRALFGESETALRSLSAAGGILHVALIYLLGRRIFGSARAGLVAAALLAVNAYDIGWGQQLKQYALFSMAATLAALALMRLCERPIWGSIVAYGFATAFTAYLHNYGFLVLITHPLYMVGLTIARPTYRRALVAALIGWFVAALVYAPWVPSLLAQVKRAGGGFGVPKLGPVAFYGSYEAYFGGAVLVMVAAALLALLPYRLFPAQQPEKPRVPGAIYLLLLWALAPVAIGVLSENFATAYRVRYGSTALPAVILLAAGGLERLRATWLWAGAVVLVAGITAADLPRYYREDRTSHWREAVVWLDESAVPEDVVLIHSNWDKVAFDYYFRRRDVKSIGVPFNGHPVSERTRAEIAELTSGYRRVWFVLGYSEDPNGIILATLRELYEKETLNDKFRALKIYSFSSRR